MTGQQGSDTDTNTRNSPPSDLPSRVLRLEQMMATLTGHVEQLAKVSGNLEALLRETARETHQAVKELSSRLETSTRPNFTLLLSLFVTSAAVVGWFVDARFNSARDQVAEHTAMIGKLQEADERYSNARREADVEAATLKERTRWMEAAIKGQKP